MLDKNENKININSNLNKFIDKDSLLNEDEEYVEINLLLEDSDNPGYKKIIKKDNHKNPGLLID